MATIRFSPRRRRDSVKDAVILLTLCTGSAPPCSALMRVATVMYKWSSLQQ